MDGAGKWKAKMLWKLTYKCMPGPDNHENTRPPDTLFLRKIIKNPDVVFFMNTVFM